MGGLAGPEQQYSLRWNDYHASILSSFRHLRDEEDFVDVTLACDGRSFTAHKVVLSACSPYFRTLLKANPCQHPIVILRDVREQDMKALLKFMYNGEVHIGEEQLPDFLKTAQTLQVRGLADVPGKEHPKFNPSGPNPVPWSVPSAESRLGGDEGMTPPPVKRSRSSDHMTSPSPSTTPNNISTPNNNNNNIESNQNNNCRDLILSQALENPSQLLNNSNMTIKLTSESSLHAHSTGEDSNSSDTELSERGHSVTGDGVKSEPNSDFNDHGSHPMDHARPPPNFPAALLGLQGLPGLLPGPSGMHGNNQDSNFVSRRSGLDMMRVRATDPRPCPKCGKIYRSAHTLRTHLEDKHTICPGYRCVLCGTVAKSRNSLHSHMSRQHRGISTKDLPVLPMPSPFDPELASRLLAKAGIKISPAELRARASPTGQTTPGLPRLDLKSRENSICGSEDPEDLTVHSNNNNNNNHSAARFGSVELRALSPSPNYQSVISKFAGGNLSLTPSKDREVPGPSGPTGNPLLDTYLQMIAENSYHQLSAEQAAKVAAKISAEQRLALENNHMMDDTEYSSGAEDEFSEEEPEPIKAE